MSRISRIRGLSWLGIFSLLVTLVLTACGDNTAAPTVAATTAAATTAAATSAAATTAAATSAAATTAAATSAAATTAAATSAAATTAAATSAAATTAAATSAAATSAAATSAAATTAAGGATATLPANYNKVNTNVKGDVRFGTWEGGDTITQINQVIDAFKKQYPNVNVKLEAVPTDYGTKLQNQIAAGNAPDVFQIGDGDARLFVDRGGAEDLTPYITGQYGLDQSIYFENVLNIGKVDNKLYYMPKDWTGMGVYYNKKLFADAGITVPANGDWTWDQFRDMAKKMTKKDQEQWGALYFDQLNHRDAYPLVLAMGGDYLSQDGTKIAGVLDSDATIQALNLTNQMIYTDQSMPDLKYVKSNGGADIFNNGKAGMFVFAYWSMADYLGAKPLDFDWGVLPLPHMTGKAPTNVIYWAGLAMNKKSQNKDAAWEFLKFLSGPEAGRIRNQFSIKAVAAELSAKEPRYAPFTSVAAQYFTPLPELRTRYFNDTIGKFLDKGLEDAQLNGTKDFTQVVKQAATDSQKELDRLRAQGS